MLPEKELAGSPIQKHHSRIAALMILTEKFTTAKMILQMCCRANANYCKQSFSSRHCHNALEPLIFQGSLCIIKP
jgi:hypothetical protein